jgi:large subunit ribosomal protein L1
MKLTKKKKEAMALYDNTKSYSLVEAAEIIKKISNTNFDPSFDIDVRLGVDPRQANQMVRGVASLPHGLGKTVRVLALVTPDKEQEAKDAGADHVGLDDYIEKIAGGWTDIDIIVAMPAVMAKLGRLGKVLGPRNLMPNPKSGTVTVEVGKAVTEVKAGKIDFKVDKTGIIHASVGKVSFDAQKLSENALELVQVLHRLKPSAAKGTYFKSIFVSSTMSPSVSIDVKSIPGI